MTSVNWLLAAVAAVLVGLSKTGMPGVAIPSVWLMAEAFGTDAKQSVGAITLLLIVGDVFAVAYYRRHAQWDQIRKLLPYMIAGMIPAYWLLGIATSQQLRPGLGWLILGLLALEACRKWFGWQDVPKAWWFVGRWAFWPVLGRRWGTPPDR